MPLRLPAVRGAPPRRGPRRRAFLVAAAALLAPALTRPLAARAIGSASLAQDESAVRLTLAVAEPVVFRLFTLDNPLRLVIDIEGAPWRAGAPPAGVGPVTRIRAALNRPGVTRVVLDLSEPVTVRRAALEPDGSALVVELAPAPRAVFLREERASDPLPRPPTPPERPLIVLDPGHGGRDPGAIGASGTQEKRVALAAALELRRILEASGRYRVAMTRTRDVFVPLAERVRFAQTRNAALFLSIHADALDDASVRGASVYTLAEHASDAIAERIARNENRADRFAGPSFTGVTPEVARILISLVRRETLNGSARMARHAVASLRREVTMLPNSHRFAGFVVLKAPDVPSVLIEMGFMSSRADEALLRRADHRRKLAAAMAEAVQRYAEEAVPVRAAG
ncbi:N-acetylmuramoyl-L-alanine amidase [Elioraea sp.]|uniref:N-acetylmuramoyl-L-alanine amidase n=1 Tax=Elioraea sp. TaxID=2185103 RepID=UPI003F718013